MHLLLLQPLRPLTNLLAKWGWQRARRSIALLNALQAAGFDLGTPPPDFEGVYAYSVVEYGTLRGEVLRDFFAAATMRDAFRNYVNENDIAILHEAAEGVVENDLTGRLRHLDYNPRREFPAFISIFQRNLDRTRTLYETRHDQQMAEVLRGIQALQGLAPLLESLASGPSITRSAIVRRVRDLKIGADVLVAERGYRADLYIERSADEQARQAFANLQGVIVVGKPLSGKSRCALHLIQADSEAIVVIPRSPFPPERFDASRLVGKDVYLLYDDLHASAQTSHPLEWWHQIQACGARSCRLICTARDGEKWEVVQAVHESLIARLHDGGIVYTSGTEGDGGDWSDVEGWALAQRIGMSRAEFAARFDGTPGSLTLDLGAMRQRYLVLLGQTRRDRAGDVSMSRLLDAAKILDRSRQPRFPTALIRAVAEQIRGGGEAIGSETWDELRRRTEAEAFGSFDATGEFRTYRPYLERCVAYEPTREDVEHLLPILRQGGDYESLYYLGTALDLDFGSPLAPEAYRAATRMVTEQTLVPQNTDLPDDSVLEEMDDRRHGAFATLRTLTARDPEEAERLIVEELLPFCLREQPGLDNTHTRMIRYRELLEAWVDQYRGESHSTIRDHVLVRLRSLLPSPDAESTCWIIASIGFRQEGIAEDLWRIVDTHDNPVGDAALHAIAALGLSRNDRPRVLEAAHQRMAARFTVALWNIIMDLADPASISVISDHWLPESSAARSDSETLHRSVVLRALVAIAAAAPEDAVLQETVWHVIETAVADDPDARYANIYLNSSAVTQCDSERAIPFIARLLSHETGPSGAGFYNRIRLTKRLLDCVLPRQLASWDTIVDDDIIGTLREDAGRDTQSPGRWHTAQEDLKETAWNLLILLGQIDMEDALDDMLREESNGYERGALMDQLACLRLAALPSAVSEAITGEYDRQGGDSSGEFVARLSAIRVVRSAASRDAFDALLNFGVTNQGGVLRASVEALSDVAIPLRSSGDMAIVDDVLGVVVSTPNRHHRVAATGALQGLAEAGFITPTEMLGLLPLLDDTERPSFERSLLVSTIGHVRNFPIPHDLLRRMSEYAEGGDDDLRVRALEVLARHDRLPDFPDLLTRYIGLRSDGAEWRLNRDAERITWSGYIIGLLYTRNPGVFTEAVADALRSLDWQSVTQLLTALSSYHSEIFEEPVPQTIQDALIERIRSGVLDPQILHVAAELMPDALGRESWQDVWGRWRAETRAEFADALGAAAYTASDAADGAAALLRILIQDVNYGVRRAAYRGLSLLSVQSLAVLCRSWSMCPDTRLRQYGAEAVGWLEGHDSEDATIEEIHQWLVDDSEPTVRESLKRSMQDRRERNLAREYAHRLCGIDDGTNEEIMAAWRYAEAITRVGDDESIRSLRSDLAWHGRPSHVGYWFERTIERIEERWSKVVAEWPDPWFPWTGAVYEGEGELIVGGMPPIAIRYSVWTSAPSDPSGVHAWGGWAEFIEDSGYLQPEEEYTIRLADRRTGRILVGSAPVRAHRNQSIEFSGQGQFPS